jgi:hypothetical protein
MTTMIAVVLIVLSLGGCTVSPETYHNQSIHQLSLEGGGG